MSERDDNELQERIESLTLSLKEEYRYGTEEAVLIYEAELRSLTALCRHRDRVFEYDLINCAIIDDVWTPKLDRQIKELRTWRYT